MLKLNDGESKDSKPLFISIGSNINPLENLNSAINYLEKEFGEVKISNFYKSSAIVGPINREKQEDFLNAAILTESNLAIEFIKINILRKIEEKLNRVRTSDKFAPRTIDLDIALYGTIVKYSENIIIPDPDIDKYAHIIYPLHDLDPNFIHPVKKLTLEAIKSTIVNSEVIVFNNKRIK